MIASYKTLIVRFNSPIAVIDEVFNDAAYLGVGNLKEWIDDYESTRFTAIDPTMLSPETLPRPMLLKKFPIMSPP